MSNYDEPHFNYNREIIITQPNKDKPAHIVNIRESSIETMYYKKNIDAIQYHAGSIFRRKWEMSQLISKPEVKVRVDQSINMSIPDAKLDAMDELNRLYGVIGTKSYDILEYVCGFGYNLKQLNHKFKFPRSYGSHRFKECLDETAIFYGLKDMGNTIRGNKKR
jgi:hypothetical protein|tara:strand:+ start:718 stop:1209 length:492 start_codon:yes stop_codon:yes gene_type:complete